MSKRSELITTKALVKSILEKNKRARNSDSYLYLLVLYKIAAIKKIDLSSITITEFLLNRSIWGFPPYISVGRSRRQIQHDCPELRSCKKVQAVKDENELIFKDFSRGVLG